MGEYAEFYLEYGLDPSDPGHMDQFYTMYAPTAHAATTSGTGGRRNNRNRASRSKKNRGGRGKGNRHRAGPSTLPSTSDAGSAPSKLNPAAAEWFAGTNPATPLNPSAAEWRPAKTEDVPEGASVASTSASTVESSSTQSPPTLQSSPPHVRLWIGNIPFETEEHEILELCGRWGDGPLTECVMPRLTDGRFRGFAFITMPADQGGVTIKNLNGLEFRGRKIRAREARAH